MSLISKVWNPEQLAIFVRDYVLSKNVGLTDWNEGSKNLTLAEAVGNIISMVALDFISALRKSIPISFYEAMGFSKKAAYSSNGYIRLYRIPELWIKYTGSGTSAQITNNGSTFDIVVTGAGDSISLDFVTYPTIADIVTAIDGHAAYECYYTGSDDTQSPNLLFYYTGQEIIGELNYRNNDGRDVLLGPASSIIIPINYQIGLNNLIFSTLESKTIAAGDASSPQISSQCLTTGPSGNIGIAAIDTLNGFGFIISQVAGVEHIINDSSFINGSDEETDQEQSERFLQYVQGLNQGTLNAIQSETLKVAGIRSVSVRDGYPGAGFVQIVADNGSGVLTTDQIDEIQKRMYGDIDDIENYPGVRATGITISIIAPVVVPVNFTINLYRIGELSDPLQLENTVKTVTEQYVNTRKLGDDMVRSELSKRIKSSHSAIYDVVISSPAANVPAGDDEVLRTGAGVSATITVTITTYTAKP